MVPFIVLSNAQRSQEAIVDKKTEVKLGRIKKTQVVVNVTGTTQLVQHKFDEKSRKQILDKKLGKKSRKREKSDPKAEYEAAMHLTADGKYGIPVSAVKCALINAAHKDIGIEKTLVKKGVYLICHDPNGVIEMQCSEPIMREDPVRVGMGGTDLRWRPQFDNWSATIEAELTDMFMDQETFVNLLDLAGSAAGLCENRPEKGGDWGRFEVERSEPDDD